MNKVFIIRIISVLSVFLPATLFVYPQEKRLPACRLMLYNVENLFDIHDDPLKDDNEFLPEGPRHWNFSRYRKKINSLYQVIVAAGEWDPPSLVAFCEVENRLVLEDLLNLTYLSKYDYGIIHEESPDQRGIDVCMIYRKDIVSIAEYQYWAPALNGGEEFRSRKTLYARCLIQSDIVHLIINHWPSRRGGVLAGEDMRMRLSALIRAKIDSILISDQGRSKIIVTGDFNCAPEDKTMAALLSSPGVRGVNTTLINLSTIQADKGMGTYRYMGSWEMPDQMIVSDYLISCTEGLCTDRSMVKIFKPDFLLYFNSMYPGKSPKPTYYGYRYTGGFSDHLPVLLDLKVR
jgi:hypothetical protein